MKILIVLSLFSMMFCVQAEASIDRTVSVGGQCTRSVTPDRASITFTAEIEEKDPSKAGKEAAAMYESLRKEVKKLALPDMELASSEYTVEQVREYRKDRYVPTGNYKARMGLKVTTSDPGQIGKAIPLASKLDFQDIGNLTLSISPQKLQKEKAACLEEAAEDARAKAGKLAEALHAHVGEVVTITEGAESHYQPRFFAGKQAMVAAAADTEQAPTIEAGATDISLTVTATFALK